MTTDLRHLLTIYVHAHRTGNSVPPHIDAEARAALADEPAAPEGREPVAVIGELSDKRPTKHELFKLLVQTGGAIRCVSIEWIEPFARAVLARWGNPAPVPPADGEVAELMEGLRLISDGMSAIGHDSDSWFVARAAKLLQRQALVPVSVSERLPGPEVCVPHPRTKRGNWCWGFERCEVSLARPARWRLMHMETVEMEASHWLPAHALPIPQQQENAND